MQRATTRSCAPLASQLLHARASLQVDLARAIKLVWCPGSSCTRDSPIMASLTTCLGGRSSWRRPVLLHRLVVVAMAAAAFRPQVAHGAASAGQQKISAIFMFGDSIVDPGNNNNRFTEAKAKGVFDMGQFSGSSSPHAGSRCLISFHCSSTRLQ